MQELEKEDERRCDEHALKACSAFGKGRDVSVLDLVPDDLCRHLESGHVYCIPPGSVRRAKGRPLYNLASLLSSGLRPEKILLPFFPEPDKNTFKQVYGLSKDLGLTYENFLELIRNGNLLLHAAFPLTEYKAEFHREIFKACEGQDYFPSHLTSVSLFMWITKVTQITAKETSFTKEGLEKVLERHSEYDQRFIKGEATRLFGRWKEEISREMQIREEDVLDSAWTFIFRSRIFGFEVLTKKVLGLARKDPVFGFNVLQLYDRYLIGPCFPALFGESFYDLKDVETMSFLRVIPNDLSIVWEGFLFTAPSSMKLICDPFEANIVVEPKEDELVKFITRYEDEELTNHMVSFQKAAQKYDFDEILRNYEKLSEIVHDRVNREHEECFRRSKLIKTTIRMGLGLTGAIGAGAGFEKLHWMPQEMLRYAKPFLSGIFGKILERTMTPGVDKVSAWLVEKWPFAEKGLPFVFWEYGVRPSRPKRKLR